MKKVLLLSLSITIWPLTFAQELSKEDKTARKELVSRIWTLKKHEPIIYIGPRGGIYRMSSGGNKVYLPRR